MQGYRRGSHTIFQIKYHFVWVTKYRYQVLRGAVAERARSLIRQTCLGLEVNIVRGHVSKDHVHTQVFLRMVSCPPALAPSQIMKRVKGRCSRKLQQEFPHLRRRYWGRHFWARGYFCSTVGEVTEEQIREYIERHDQEPPDENFKVEA